MKNLKNIAVSFLFASLLFGCHYNGIPQKHLPTQSQHIPIEDATQEQLPATKDGEPVADVAKSASEIKIALLVPLSGQHKDLGQGLLNAAELAMFKIGDERIHLIPIDTKGSAPGAVEAAKEAVAVGAKVILGPVFSSSAKAIAKIASENNIQVVSFSNDQTLAGTGVFAIGFLPQQQINRVVSYAANHGIKEYVTLLPNDAYGNVVLRELKQMATNNTDISIVKSETYQADSAGRIISLDARMKGVMDAVKAKKSDGPIGLVAPANSAATSSILNYLAQNMVDKTKVQLLGSDQWNDDKLLSNQSFEGALFTSSPTERRVDFEGKFRSTYGKEPPKLASLAYDGVALSVTVAKASGDGNFTREALTSSRGFVGVDGIFRLREDGLTERGFSIMNVKSGHFVVIEPAPKSFAEFK